MTDVTIFTPVYQGEYGDEENAVLVAVFSTPAKAQEFAQKMSLAHTAAKREAYERLNQHLPVEPIPDLYWDWTGEVAFDPRSIEELL